MFVYFIQAGEGGPIKIGVASKWETRFSKLRADNHEEVRLVGFLDGDKQIEAGLHDRFAPDHIRGEWFRPSPALLAYIAENAKKPDRVPTEKRLTWRHKPIVSHRDLIRALGGPTVLAPALSRACHVDMTRSALYAWSKNGIPWRWRFVIARMADREGLSVPEDLADHLDHVRSSSFRLADEREAA